jgi:hypothetical protein
MIGPLEKLRIWRTSKKWSMMSITPEVMSAAGVKAARCDHSIARIAKYVKGPQRAPKKAGVSRNAT